MVSNSEPHINVAGADPVPATIVFRDTADAIAQLEEEAAWIRGELSRLRAIMRDARSALLDGREQGDVIHGEGGTVVITSKTGNRRVNQEGLAHHREVLEDLGIVKVTPREPEIKSLLGVQAITKRQVELAAAGVPIGDVVSPAATTLDVEMVPEKTDGKG